MTACDLALSIHRANPWSCWADCVMAAIYPDDHQEIPDELQSAAECLQAEVNSGHTHGVCYCGGSVERILLSLVHMAGGEPVGSVRDYDAGGDPW